MHVAVCDRDAAAVGAVTPQLRELPVKQASALTATITGVRKNELYALALEMKRENQGPG